MQTTARWIVLLLVLARPAGAGTMTITARQLPAGPWVAAAGTTAPALRYVSLEAKGGGGMVKLVPQTCVGRSSGNIAMVSAPGETLLTEGLPTVVTLTATGLTQPDTYDVLLSLRTATAPVREIAPLRLELYAVPSAVASPASQHFQLVAQGAGSAWLFSAESRTEVPLTVPGSIPLVRSWDVRAAGATTGRRLTTSDLLTPRDPLRRDRRGLVVPLRFDLDALAPDRYDGDVLLNTGAPNLPPLAVPFTIAVRAAPSVPLLLLLAGIALGLFAAYVERERNRRAALMQRLERLPKDAANRCAIVERIANGDLAEAELAVRELEGASPPPRLRDRVASAISGVPIDPHRWASDGSPAAYIVARGIAVLLLAAAGIYTVYLRNDTFGAGGITDYAGLLLWGLGADVTARMLANVMPLLPRR